MKRFLISRPFASRADLVLLALQGELGAQAGQDHREVEGLRHVVVGPQAKRLDHVLGWRRGR